MFSVDYLREFVNERLTAAAEEIFGVFKRTIAQYEEEIDRQRRLLDIFFKPKIKLQKIELPQQHVCKEEEVLTDQQLPIQERSSSPDQEDPEPPQIKEEQEEPCISQLVLKQEADTFMLTPSNEESGHSEDQTLTFNLDDTIRAADKESVVNMPVIISVVSESKSDRQLLSQEAESQDHKGGKQEDSGSTRNAEPKQDNHKSNSQTNNVCNYANIFTRRKSFKCDTCGKAFDCQSKLQRHLTIHTGEKPYPCKTCGKSFSFKSTLNNHMRIHTDEKPYSCNTCGKSFRYKRTLNDHIITHTGERPYSCDTCGITFSRKSALKIHIRTHTGEKPYPCNTCEKRFYRKHHLKMHMIIHTDEKLYVCKTCERAFRRSDELKTHMRIHTGEKPYICDTCGRGFRLNGGLKDHVRRAHTGERPYMCKTCGKRFFDASYFARHTRLHTGK